jgi:hypothetical protein
LIRGSGAIGHALTNDVSGEVRAETPASRIVFNALGVTATNPRDDQTRWTAGAWSSSGR